MTIHREGRTLLFVLLVVLFALNWAASYFFPSATTLQNIGIGASLVIYLIILQFFRIPLFEVQKNPKQVLAPADGKVVVIEETEETEYLKSRRKQISIFMSPINVHVNRMPVAGAISYFKYHPGKYLVAWHPKSSTENERTTIVIEQPEKKLEVLFRQIAGAMARRVVNYSQEGEPVMQGAEMGFIKFGSRVDLFLPLGTKIKVKLGDKTVGGESIVASFA